MAIHTATMHNPHDSRASSIAGDVICLVEHVSIGLDGRHTRRQRQAPGERD